MIYSIKTSLWKYTLMGCWLAFRFPSPSGSETQHILKHFFLHSAVYDEGQNAVAVVFRFDITLFQ